MADSTPTYNNRFFAELFGTFVLVFSVGGAALFTLIFSTGLSGYNGAGYLGVALALGLILNNDGQVTRAATQTQEAVSHEKTPAPRLQIG